MYGKLGDFDFGGRNCFAYNLCLILKEIGFAFVRCNRITILKLHDRFIEMHYGASLGFLPRGHILLCDEIQEHLIVQLFLLLCVGIEEAVVEIFVGFVLTEADECTDIKCDIIVHLVLPNELAVVRE